MNDTRFKTSIAEAADLSGIPVEEIHARIFRGELPGDGNIAQPGNRQSGFVNAGTLERLRAEGRGRTVTGTVNPGAGAQRHFYREAPIAEAASDLGMTVSEVEILLLHGELEGAFCHPRWVGVRHESLTAYKTRQTASLCRTVATDDPPPPQAAAPVSRLRAAYRALTEHRKA